VKRRQGHLRPARGRELRLVDAEPQGLWRKLDAARNAAKAIEKHGKHKGHEDGEKFDYARIEDVVTEARSVLSEQGLLITPAVIGDHRSWSETYGLVLKVEMEFMMVDAQTGESITLPWIGYGQAKPGDKAIGTAISSAKKYFLASLLEIPFVDRDAEDDQTPKERADAAREAARIRQAQDRAAEQPDAKPKHDAAVAA